MRNVQFKKEKKLMCCLSISFAHHRNRTVRLTSFPVLWEFYFEFYFFFIPACFVCFYATMRHRLQKNYFLTINSLDTLNSNNNSINNSNNYNDNKLSWVILHSSLLSIADAFSLWFFPLYDRICVCVHPFPNILNNS